MGKFDSIYASGSVENPKKRKLASDSGPSVTESKETSPKKSKATSSKQPKADPKHRSYRQRWDQFGEKWRREYGFNVLTVMGKPVKVTWLSHKAGHGVGCSICAHLREEAEKLAPRASQRQKSRFAAYSTKFGRYEVRTPDMGASLFRLHAASRVHKRALRFWSQPPETLLEVLPEDTQVFDKQTRLLRGCVPQIGDRCNKRFLSVGDKPDAQVRSSLSFSAAAQVRGTLHFLQMANLRQKDGADEELHRKTVKKIALVIAEALTEDVRQTLLRAHSWSLSLDDKANWRLFNFQASGAEVDGGTDRQVITTKQGLLGVRQLYSKDVRPLYDTEKDYCEKVTESVSEMLHEILDNEEEFAKVSRTLTGIVADGAPSIQKGLRHVQSVFPGLLFIGRDAAHAARKSTQEAWTRETSCEEFYTRIWKDKTSLVPTIQNSFVLRSQLEAAQRLVVAKNGSQAAGLSTILRHFSYAKQRYESQAGPQLAYVLLLTSISLLLAVRASDLKLPKKDRDMAAQWLEGMTPSHAAVAGLSADFGCEAARLVRMFDTTSRDPATFRRIILDWTRKMEELFMKGRILEEPPEGRHVAGHSYCTATFVAITNFMEAAPIMYNQKVHYFWSSDGKAQVLDALDSLQVVCKASLTRLSAEFQDNLVNDLCVFDLKAWKTAKAAPDQYEAFRVTARKRVVRLCRGLGCDAEACWQQLHGCVEFLLRQSDCQQTLVSSMYIDNRPVWSKLLGQDLRPVLGHEAPELLKVFHAYNAYGSGTSCTERALGCVKTQLESHAGPLDDQTVIALTRVAWTGLSEASFCTVPSQRADDSFKATVAAAATPLTLRCAELWAARYGRRFGVYKRASPKAPAAEGHVKKKPKVGQIPGKKTTIASCRAAACTYIANSRVKGKLMLGLKDRQVEWKFDKPLKEHKKCTAKLASFEVGTQRKRATNQKKRQHLQKTGRPAEIPRPVKANLFPKTASEQPTGMILNLVGPDLVALPNTKLKVLQRPDAVRAFEAAKSVRAMVVPSVGQGFPCASADSVLFGAALAAVAFGGCIIGLSDWQKHNWNATISLEGSISAVTMRARLSERFEARHRDMVAILQKLSSVSTSRWKVVGSSDTSPNSLSINTMADLALFLQRAQRISGAAQVSGVYFK
ncbi:unnamed protein product [Symbiodinium sp. CCMP2592]|nr:unnamed protein product [Symbiodinium sp. CCMP2592]